MIPIFGLRTFLVFSGLSETTAGHPKDPHWYLLALGVDPAHQRKGLGSTLLDPALSRCDAEGVVAYLEASKPENIPFYQRHGFSVTQAMHLPKGPTIYGMRRPPVR
jgi:ribosomal protein S18 acetylase RimI-like enzyme